MNTIPANEVKRRGVIALEEGVKAGPLHIIKNNVPVCVVLSEQVYRLLLAQQKPSAPKLTLHYFLNRPASGISTPDEINDELKKLRDEWN